MRRSAPGEDDRYVLGPGREEAGDFVGHEGHLCGLGLGDDDGRAVGRARPAGQEFRDAGARLRRLLLIDRHVRDAKGPLPLLHPFLAGFVPDRELRVGKRDADGRAPAGQGDQAEEIRPIFGTARKDEEPVGNPGNVGRQLAKRTGPVLQGAELVAMRRHPVGQLPEHLGQFGTGKMRGVEAGQQQLLEIVESRIGIAIQGHPEAAGGIVRRQA